MRDLGVTFDQFPNFDDHITAICRNTYFHIRNIGKIMIFLSYNACSTIIQAGGPHAGRSDSPHYQGAM